MSELQLMNEAFAPFLKFENTSESSVPASTTPDDDRFLSDLWVGVVLALMVLSSLACLCSCFLFQAYRQWQSREDETANAEACYDSASLPSYTVVGGLPTYEEAVERAAAATFQSDSGAPSPLLSKLSVGALLQIYKEDVKK